MKTINIKMSGDFGIITCCDKCHQELENTVIMFPKEGIIQVLVSSCSNRCGDIDEKRKKCQCIYPELGSSGKMCKSCGKEIP